MMTPPLVRRSAAAVLGLWAVAAFAMLSPACQSDGHFTVLGYSTRPNYDCKYKTVSVPVFKNNTYWVATPVVGMEMDLTKAVIREIELKTPYKVVHHDNADTEIIGRITDFRKNVLNFTPLNTQRDVETVLTVELVWRDKRTGDILTKRGRRPGSGPEPEPRRPVLGNADSLLPPGSKPSVTVDTPELPGERLAAEGDVSGQGRPGEFVDPVTKKKITPVVVKSTAGFRPELGESLTTAMQKNYDRLATQIVSVMESPW